jgi:hypothetical protein
MINKPIVSVKSALHDILKDSIEKQRELNTVNYNIRIMKKYLKEQGHKVNHGVAGFEHGADISTVPSLVLNKELYFYRDQYNKNSGFRCTNTTKLTMEFLNDCTYRINFCSTLMYDALKYLAVIIDQLIINNVKDIVHMLYYHQYYIADSYFKNRYVDEFNVMYSVEREHFKDIVLYSVRNHTKSAYKRLFFTNITRESIGIPTRYFDHYYELLDEYKAYFNLIKLTSELLKECK